MNLDGKLTGPSPLRILLDLPKIRRSAPDYLVGLHRQYGDAVLLRLLRRRMYLIADAKDIRYVFVSNPRNYHKTGALTVGKELLGTGLVTSEPPQHTEQRRVIQPLFHRRAIAGFAVTMSEAVETHLRGWRDGEVVDLASEMMQLTLAIVGLTLFSIDLHAAARSVGNAFTTAQRFVTWRQWTRLPLWVPTASNVRYKAAIAAINDFIFDLISARRRLSEQPPDLVGTLINARHDDGSPLSDRQMRDEIATLLVAGHETVAQTLTWTWLAISAHPDIEARLRTEWRAIPNDAPTLEDLSKLSFTEAVLTESHRLHPAVWIIARRAVSEDRLPSGLLLAPRDRLLISQYVSHRNERYFPDPDRFDPDRWTAEFRKQVQGTAFFPFGSGPRGCIGEPFARLEAMLVLAAIGRRFKLSLLPGQRVEKEALIALRPRGGIRMRLTAR